MKTTIATEYADFRLSIARNNAIAYDYSPYVKKLGEAFIEKACQVVAQKRLDGEIKERTWRINYVTRFTYLLDALVEYRNTDGREAPSEIAEFAPSDWVSFGCWYREKISNESLSAKRKRDSIRSANRILALFALASITSIRIEIEPLDPPKKAKDGESVLTKKGWAKKRKSPPTASPYSFIIEKHKRAYDYTEFQSIASQFLLAIIPTLYMTYANYKISTAKHTHGAFNSFLRYLRTQYEQGNHSGFFGLLQSNDSRQIPSLEWESIIYQWRDTLFNSRTLRSSHEIIVSFRRIWKRLVGAGQVPEVHIRGIKNSKRRSASRTRRSLAQLAKSESNKTIEQDVWKNLEKYFKEVEQPEALEFIQALCNEISTELLKTLPISSIIEKIHEINSKWLHTIRRCAEDDFLHWFSHWERGAAALKLAKPSEQLLDLLDSPIRSSFERQNNSKALLFSGPDEERIGNALQYILATQDGVVSGLLGRYQHLARSMGGYGRMHGYLHPHNHATLALWVLLMVDTGVNCEVAREMPWDCLHHSEKTSHRKIQFAAKLRGAAATIIDELPETPDPGQRISAIQAIQLYQLMVARYRGLSDSSAENYLFLHEYSGSIHCLKESTAREWFFRFLKRHEQLSRLPATPSMIRPTFLMDVQHKNGDNVVAAQIMADHAKSSTTLLHYTGRTPTKLLYSLKIREFQDRFQAVVIVSIDGAASKLGLTEEEFQRLLSDAARTGLGVACLDPLAGVQPGTSPGQDCTRQDACHGCKMRWVVATEDNISDLILFNEHLKAVQKEEERNDADRWEKRWLPWLVFSDIAIAKLEQGETAKIFAEAVKLASTRRADYVPIPLL